MTTNVYGRDGVGLDGCPKADAMLRRVDPYGIAQGDGALSGPPGAVGGAHAGQILAIVAAALAAGAAVAMVVGAAPHARENPRGHLALAIEKLRKSRR